MDLIFSAAVVGLFVLAAAAAWPAMYALWSRAIPDTRQLNFWQLAHRRGMALKDFAGSEPEFARAMYRCIGCHEAARCDALLDADLEVPFCPNRRFLDDVAARHRRP
jgi:Family of unknown function (DUF6455)